MSGPPILWNVTFVITQFVRIVRRMATLMNYSVLRSAEKKRYQDDIIFKVKMLYVS